MVIFLVGEDIILYWTHRLFHGRRMWRYHAVHHSSEELEWISAARFHPINLFLGSVTADVVMLLAPAFRRTSFVVLGGPLTIAHSAFVSANLDWTFGPFKYVIATPVFHRWHHTAPERGGGEELRRDLPRCFFSIVGTFPMPKGELYDDYGIAEHGISRRASTVSLSILLRNSRVAETGQPVFRPCTLIVKQV